MAFANYSNYDSWLSVTNLFFKKFSNLILESRIQNSNETGKMNLEFFTSEPIFNTYKNENSFFISNDGVDFSKIENKDICLEIYFQRKNSPIKILIEKWVLSMNASCDKGGGSTNQINKINHLSLFQDSNCYVSSNKKFRKILIIKKLSTLIRSTTTYTRLLPAYIFTNKSKKGFEYILDCKSYFSQMIKSSDNLDQNLSDKKLNQSDKNDNIINQSNQMIYMREKFNKIKKKYINSCDLNLGKANLEVEYIDKNEIFIMEQEMKFLLGKSNDILISTPNHIRYHSERNVSYYDKLGIRKNTDTQDYSVRRNHNFHLVQEQDLNGPNQLKKMNSRSLDKNFQNKKNEDEGGDLNYYFLNSQEVTNPIQNNFQNFHGYSSIKNYSINIHPITDIVEIKLQHNFQEFISPNSLEMEIIELGSIKTKKKYLFDNNFISSNLEPYETRFETLEIENNHTDSFLFSDGEGDDLIISECAEEILEISDDSQNQNFYLAEDDQKREQDFMKNIFTSFKNLKVSLNYESNMNINIINLYKCVNKN